MSFLFPKKQAAPAATAPTVIMPPAAPTIDAAAQAADAGDRLRRRKGRAGYVFGGKAPPGPIQTGTKVLTGS